MKFDALLTSTSGKKKRDNPTATSSTHYVDGSALDSKRSSVAYDSALLSSEKPKKDLHEDPKEDLKKQNDDNNYYNNNNNSNNKDTTDYHTIADPPEVDLKKPKKISDNNYYNNTPAPKLAEEKKDDSENNYYNNTKETKEIKKAKNKSDRKLKKKESENFYNNVSTKNLNEVEDDTQVEKKVEQEDYYNTK